MKKQYKNQHLYEKTIKQDSQCSPYKENKKKEPCKKSLNCNLICDDVRINFEISDKHQSFSVEQTKKFDNKK